MPHSVIVSRLRRMPLSDRMRSQNFQNLGMSAPTTLSLLFLKDIRMTYRHIPTAIILGLLIIGFTPLLWISLYFANVAANNVGQVLMVDNGNAVLKLRDTPFGYHLTGPDFDSTEESTEFEKFANFISAVCGNASRVEEDEANVLIKVNKFGHEFDYELNVRPPEDIYYHTDAKFYPNIFSDNELVKSSKVKTYSESLEAIAAQSCIDMTYYYHRHNQFFVHDIYVRKLPPIMANARSKVVRPLLIAIKTILPLGILIPAVLGVVNLCNEKTSRVHQYLMMMGMRRYAFYLAHLLSGHAKMYLYAIPAGLAVAIFVPQVGWASFGLFILLGHFLLAFVYLSSTLCKSTVFVVGISIGFFTLSAGIEVWVSNSIGIYDSKTAIALAALNPMSTYNLGFRHLDIAVSYNQSVHLFSHWKYYLPLGYSYIFLGVQTLICLILTVYFDYVLPIDDSPKLHPLFMFGCSRTEVVEVEAAELPVHRDKIIPADCPSELLESSMEEDRGRFPPYFEMEITSKRPEIEVSKLVKKWPNGELALKGVSLKAFRGQVTALLGPNGAGKSTIFGCLAGFIKPSAGIIRISGEPPGAASGITNIGYCPQWNPLFSYLTVSEHLNFYGSIKTGDNVVKDDVEEVLRLTDLTADRHRKVHNLTAGQKRKLSVGIALIGNCRVLLLDEPTAGMDLAGRKIMIDIIERVKTNKAVLLTTHYMDDADYLSDKIMIMAKGEMVCNGSVDFLRARFGTGIMMTIEFSQSSDEDDSNPGRFYRMAAEVLNAVLVHCDGARMDGPVGPRFNLILPHGSQRTFPDMFADLESRKEELCIEGFELRVNKLEQVFLKVTDVVDASKEDVVSVEEQVKQFIEVRSEEVSPTGLFFQQMQALLTRKFFYMKSHWFQHAILLFFIIPLAVPMIMNLAHPSSRHHESIHDQPEPTTLSHYPGMTVFVASTLGSKVGKPIAKFLNSSENVIVVRMPTAGNIVDEPRKLMLHRIVEKFVHNVPPLAFGVAVDMRESAHLKVKRDIVIYYRTLFPNGAALALTAVANSFYKDETPITTTIGVEQNYPLEVSIIGSATMVTTLTPIFVTFIFTYPILLLATERRRRTIIMYLCARMPRYLYWIAAFVGDSLTAIVPLIVLTVALFGSLYFQVRCLPLYLLVIFPTCVSFLTQSYIFAMIFRNGALATALLQIFNVIIAGVSIFVGGTIASKGGMIVIQILTILFPSAIIFQLSLFLESRCSTIHKSHAHTLTPPQSIFRFCHNHDGIKDASFCGAEILLTAYGGAVFQLIIFTGLALRTWLAQRIQCRREPKELTGRPSEDNDVVEERERVDSMGTASYAVCAQNLRKDYGKKTALRNATFGVSEGEIFGLLGPCGSGKSTILAMLSGVYPVTSGRAYFDGVDVEERPLVGYCTQAHSLLNELTIKQTFKLFAKLAGARQSTRCAELLMEILQLEAKADSVVDNCSCGEKRRISIGVSLIVNPRLQLLDEPTTGVDPRTRRSLWQVLTAFSSQGSTIVMASDSVDESDALCSRIAFLANGEIVGIGNGDHLRQLYGNSYLLSITMYGPDNTLAAQIDSEVQRVFEASPLTVVDNIPGLSWTFPRSPDVPLSELYSNLVDLVDSLPPTPKRDRFPVKDFYIVAANLEDVFHAIAKRNMNQSVEKI